jgi:hypothetical protein
MVTPCIRSQHLIHARRLDRQNAASLADQQARHVRQVKLAGGVLVGELAQVGEQRLCLKAIDTRVDLRRARIADRQVLLLHDGQHLARPRLAHDAAITGRIGRHCRQDRHRGMLPQVEIAQRSQRLGTDERHVAREHQQMPRWRDAGLQKILRDHLQSVSRAALLPLLDELHARLFDGRPHTLALMPNDAVDVRCSGDRLGGGNHMQQQRSPANLVQDLGAFRAEPGAFAGSHDGDAEGVGFHTLIIVS